MKLEKRKTLFRSLFEAKKTVIFGKKKQTQTSKEKNYGPILLKKIDAKILSKISASRT